MIRGARPSQFKFTIFFVRKNWLGGDKSLLKNSTIDS